MKSSRSLAVRQHALAIASLRQRIISALTNTGSSKQVESLESILKSAPQDILLHAFNDEHTIAYPLMIACVLYSEAAKHSGFSHYLPAQEKDILLMLDYGANPNLTSLKQTPIQSLFIDIILPRLPINYQFKSLKIVEKLIEKGADLTVTGENQFSLIHMAAALSREALCMIAEKLSLEWVNKKNVYGETALFTAIRFGNNACALELILNRQINIDSLTTDQSAAINACVFFLNPTIANVLLNQGSTIDPLRNTIIAPHADAQVENIRKLLLILMKGGFYIPLPMRSAQYEAIASFFPSINPDLLFVIALEDIETKKIEYINELESLKTATSKISPAQTKRLHQSFQEAIRCYEIENMQILAEELKEAYDAFKAKYPYTQTIVLPSLEQMPEQMGHETKTVDVFKNFLMDASAAYENIGLMLSLLHSAKEILEEDKITVISTDKLQKSIPEYNNGLIHAMTVLGEKKAHGTFFEIFISKLTYMFTVSQTWKLLDQAKSREELIAIHDSLIFLVSLAMSFKLKFDDKALDESTALIQKIIDVYQNLGVSDLKTLYFIILREIFKIKIYSEMNFFSDIALSLDELKKYESALDRERESLRKKNALHASYGLFDNINQTFIRCLENINNEDTSLIDHCYLYEQILYLADRYNLAESLNKLAEHKTKIMAQYKRFFDSLDVLSNPPNDLFSLKFVNDELYIIFDEAASKKRINQTLVKTGIIRAGVNQYIFPFFGMSFEAIKERIDFLKTLNLNNFKRTEVTRAVAANEAEPKQWYPATPADHRISSNSSSSSLSSSSKNKKDKISISNVSNAEFDQKCMRIKNNLAKSNHVAPENVFIIHAPWLPKAREYYAWGVWGEIKGENIDRVPQALIDEHKMIAQKGKVVVKAQGEAGLKSTMILNQHTNKTERSLKTKNLGHNGNLRIISTPEDFAFEGENLKLYRFGTTTFHQ